jgi:stage III sporulation protein AA
LIVSPPLAGKTTLLRDFVRQLSDGIPTLGFKGVNVGLVDERSEVAGTYLGYPQFDIGIRTDVLDGCPKAQGVMMLIRSMSPQVVATDEIGRPEDMEALQEALQAGVVVFTTIHGESYEEIKTRPFFKEVDSWRLFERIVILSRRLGVGTVEGIYEGRTQKRMDHYA